MSQRLPTSLILLVLIALLVYSVSAHPTLLPSSAKEIEVGAEENEEVHVALPVSYAGIVERYALKMRNERDVDLVGIQVRIPAGFELLSTEQPAGWDSEIVRAEEGGVVVVWEGGVINPGDEAEYVALIRNPVYNPVLGRPLYEVLVIEMYSDGKFEANRLPIVLTYGTDIFGTDMRQAVIYVLLTAFVAAVLENVLPHVIRRR